MKFTRWFVMTLLAKFQTAVMIPVTQWAVNGLDLPKAETATAEYAEPCSTFNASVIQMAQKDREEYLSAHPELFQAELNGLLEALRTEALNQGLLSFFGALMQQGHAPDECMRRSAANTIHLGMFLQKRMGAN